MGKGRNYVSAGCGPPERRVLRLIEREDDSADGQLRMLTRDLKEQINGQSHKTIAAKLRARGWTKL